MSGLGDFDAGVAQRRFGWPTEGDDGHVLVIRVDRGDGPLLAGASDDRAEGGHGGRIVPFAGAVGEPEEQPIGGHSSLSFCGDPGAMALVRVTAGGTKLVGTRHGTGVVLHVKPAGPACLPRLGLGRGNADEAFHAVKATVAADDPWGPANRVRLAVDDRPSVDARFAEHVVVVDL